MDETSNQRRTHRVTKTEVVKITDDTFGVAFKYDDGEEATVEVGDKKTAEFYAKVQKGEVLPVGLRPLLLNEAKAQKLRLK